MAHAASVTLQEAARRWRVSVTTVRRLVAAGDLPAFRVGRQLRIPRDAVAAVEAPSATPTRKV